MRIDPDLADRVREATGGRPDLLDAAERCLEGIDPAVQDLAYALAEPLHGAVGSCLAELPAEARAAVADVAGLVPVTARLWSDLGHDPCTMELVAEAGILVPSARGNRIVPVVAAVLGGSPRLKEAAAWYADNGPVFAAVKAYHEAGDEDNARNLVDLHGDALLAAGHGGLLVDVLEHGASTRRRRLLLGDALRVTGQVMSAARAYDIGKGADVAWRAGLVHYLRGDSRAALAVFDGEPLGEPTVDTALVRAWAATAQLQLGEVEAATDRARSAVRDAAAVADDTALATAYVSLALCLSMAGQETESDELLAQALTIAARLGDVVLRARILTTQTYRLLREARYAEALDAARRTEQCASLAGHANLRSLALCNGGDALAMLGRFDEAIDQYERATALGRRMGSRRSAAAHLGLGEVYRRREWTEQARGAYETAARLAEEAGNCQVLAAALAGLAILLAPTDTPTASGFADRAHAIRAPGTISLALLARGWTSLYAEDAAGAASAAEEALAAARADGDRAVLAEALELRAALTPDVRPARDALREASAIWEGAGSTVEAARVRCRLGTLPGASTDDRLAGLVAADTLTAAGVPFRPPPAGPAAASVAIRAFGRFEVLVDGEPVPSGQWQSRKARDLLRVLVARRGRPIPRGELSEMVWPDDDPERTGHRLSVLLSIVRTALSGPYLIADPSGVALDITRVDVDVERFLADVGHGRRLRDRGCTAQAYALLSEAVMRCRADVFEDEPYADWAQPLREEARAALVTALRILADLARSLGDPGAAVEHLLRLLAVDPYDEAGHRALVETHSSAGQHGEARRAYARYRSAMAAIGVRPRPPQYGDPQYQDPMLSA